MRRIHKGAILLVVASLAIIWFVTGCGDRVSGERDTNQSPELFFVNVPPDGTQTSVDPVVHWVGMDGDGVIDYYRYIVVRSDEMGGLEPDEYAQTVLSNLPASAWTVVDAEPEDPSTSNVISVSADLGDPVSTYVQSYIFAQAFDDLGASSPVIWRSFFRNDNPPDTDISIENKVFIDAVQPGGAITGMRFVVEGEDPDPADSLFEFQWKLYGPYDDDPSAPGDEWDLMLEEYVRDAVVTNDSRVFIIGYGFVDTVITTSIDGGAVSIETTLVLIDTVSGGNIDPFYGSIDQVFDLGAFQQDPTYFKPVDSSFNGVDGWVSNNRDERYRDSVFNMYRNESFNVTEQRKFLLWAQSRDAALVVDGTPHWEAVEVVLPKHERDVLILDFLGFFGRINAPEFVFGDSEADSSKQYWKRAVDAWSNNYRGGQIEFDVFDTEVDWVNLPSVGNQLSLEKLLAYKMIILYNDNTSGAGFVAFGGGGATGLALQVFTSIDAGVSVFACWRSPIEGGTGEPLRDSLATPAEYQQYFGVRRVAYTGWASACRNGITADSIPIRIEDFIGALPLGETAPGWPSVSVDTANLHSRYSWFLSSRTDSAFAWEPGWYEPLVGPPIRRKRDSTVYALPEVGWSEVTYGADPLYLYQSVYGQRSPFGSRFIFDGGPVAVRVSTNLYRTAHFMFTPLGMDDNNMQIILDSVFNYLYDPELGNRSATTVSSGIRYPDARVWIDPQKVRENFVKRQKRLEEMGYYDIPAGTGAGK